MEASLAHREGHLELLSTLEIPIMHVLLGTLVYGRNSVPNAGSISCFTLFNASCSVASVLSSLPCLHLHNDPVNYSMTAICLTREELRRDTILPQAYKLYGRKRVLALIFQPSVPWATFRSLVYNRSILIVQTQLCEAHFFLSNCA